MIVVRDLNNVTPEPMLEGVTMRLMIGPDQGAQVFNMRIFEVQPGAATPFHDHWWEHEVYILAGNGKVRTETDARPVRKGNAVFVPGNLTHQFINTGTDILRFMCMVPQEWLEHHVTGREI
ncbi:cupin domain-containing protein [bacterium]|nr:cupin domain-containing protein [candidate division CSSED10-310 bacterium]